MTLTDLSSRMTLWGEVLSIVETDDGIIVANQAAAI